MIMTTIENLKDQQTENTAQISWVRREFAEHPSKKITPQRLTRIFEQAEKGDIIEQCDLFADMEERDGHICAEISKRKRALLKLKWEIQPPKDASAQEVKNAQLLHDILENFPDFEDVILNLASGIGYGFSCLEIEWQKLNGFWQPKNLFDRPHRWFQLSQFDRNVIKLRDGSSDGAQLWQAGWLVHKHKAKSGDVSQMGLHRALAFPFLFKQYALNDFAEFLEIYGLPLVIGKYETGESEESRKKLLRALTEIGHNARGIIPKSQEIEFLEAATKGTGEPFKAMIDWCESTQSKIILGATLTTQSTGSTSTNALGNVHKVVFDDLVASDAVQIASTLTRLLALICEVNGLKGRTPRFVFDTNQPEEFATQVPSLIELAKAGLPIPQSYLHEKFRIPQPKDGEPVLKIAPSPQQPAAMTALSVETIPIKFTPDQQTVENIADDLLDNVTAPLSNQQLQSVIRAAKSPEDLESRLAVLMANADFSQFTKTLERSLFAADVLGYAHADA